MKFILVLLLFLVGCMSNVLDTRSDFSSVIIPKEEAFFLVKNLDALKEITSIATKSRCISYRWKNR